MIRFLHYNFLKIELIRLRINKKLPRLFRITKFGVITTFISLIIATSVGVTYAKEYPNINRWMGDQHVLGEEADADAVQNGWAPAMISTLDSIVGGRVDYNPANASYEVKGSLLAATNNLVVETYGQTDQISGVRYIANTLEDAKLIQPVQAQASGYKTFEPVIEVWKIMRNIALGFIVMIGMILALMILFRVRSGQGYVTILNALPKLVVTVLLILFSYSISGFIVDISNVGEKLIVNVFWDQFIEESFRSTAEPEDYPANIYGPLGDPGARQKYSEDRVEDWNVFRLLSSFTKFETWGGPGTEIGVADILRTPTGIGIIDAGVDIIEELPADQLLNLIITIVIIMSVLKIFFALIKAFAQMILYTIFAPFAFLFFPLSGGTFSAWLRHFLASSLLFPAAFLMMMLAAIIIGIPHAPWYTRPLGSEGSITFAGAAPNMILYTVSGSVDLARPDKTFITKIIGLMIVLMIPTLPQFIMQQLKVTENMMVEGAKTQFKSVASKFPIIGGAFGM